MQDEKDSETGTEVLVEDSGLDLRAAPLCGGRIELLAAPLRDFTEDTKPMNFTASQWRLAQL